MDTKSWFEGRRFQITKAGKSRFHFTKNDSVNMILFLIPRRFAADAAGSAGNGAWHHISAF
jgi:hypothetical protein